MREVKVKENSWVAAIASRVLKTKQVAIVFGHTIFLHRTSFEDFAADHKWLAHELKHVEQYERYGYLRFVVLYLWESAKKGYRNNHFEAEARAAEENETGRHYMIQKLA